MDIGRFQKLTIARDSPHGVYLTDGETEVLLPNKEVPKDAHLGDALEVFVLTDSEDRPVATTQRPYGQVDSFAALQVVAVTPAGAFLDWGLDKDLFCPRREQLRPLKVNEWCVARIYLDELSQRVVCTTRLNRFLRLNGRELATGEKVSILVTELHPEYVGVIVNGELRASLYPDEWHEALRVGDERSAYVKAVRPEDGRVALSLRPQGQVGVASEREKLLEMLREARGFLPVNDNSSPEEIHKRFGWSKGMFKRLIGGLFREGLIDLEPAGIRLRHR